jgi:uncharacterized SAM-binding protein YcdF (DUF218 family)
VKKVQRSRARRLVARTLLLSCALVCVAGIWWWPRAGRYLVVETPLQPADAIVVLAGPRVERWLEGVELYREKVAPRILLSSGRIEAAESALRARDIKFPREVDLIKDAMVQLHVPADRIETFPDGVDNTAAEASVTHGIASQRGWRRLIVVTSKYHTRRSLYAFEREFRGSGVQIQVHATRFDTARPDAWWKHRADFRYVISEYQKLLAYRLGLEG